jgi:hypothetical protein
MDAQVSDFIDVKAKVTTLGCAMPAGVTVLPYNFESAENKDALCYVGYHLDLRKVLRRSGISGTSLEESEDTAVQVLLEESAFPEWIPPTIFVAANLLSQNPTLAGLVLGVVSNFLYDLFKNVLEREPTKSDEVEFSVVTLSLGALTYKKATFRGFWKKGQLEGLEEFVKTIRKM